MMFVRMRNLLCIFSLLLSPLVSAQIIQTKSIMDVLNYVDKDTDVIFDLDLVIGFPIPHPQPSKRLMLIEKKAHYDFVLEQLRKMNAHAYVLTARVPEHQVTTIAQLDYNGLSFKELTPFKEGATYTVHLSSNGLAFRKVTPYYPGNHSVTHSNGVVCCGLLPKANVACNLLSLHNRKPKRVIFIDDKKSNLESVELALREMGITDFIGLHYTRVTGGLEFGFLKPISRLYKKHPYILCLAIGACALIPAYFLYKKAFSYQTRENAVN